MKQPDIVEQLEDWIAASPAVCERKLYAACKDEILSLREKVEFWKSRFHSKCPEEAELYNATDDFAKSIDEAYRVIRERIRNGGPGWTPP